MKKLLDKYPKTLEHLRNCPHCNKNRSVIKETDSDSCSNHTKGRRKKSKNNNLSTSLRTIPASRRTSTNRVKGSARSSQMVKKDGTESSQQHYEELKVSVVMSDAGIADPLLP